MDSEQPSFADVEYGNRRRVSKREQFLEQMEATMSNDQNLWMVLGGVT